MILAGMKSQLHIATWLLGSVLVALCGCAAEPVALDPILTPGSCPCAKPDGSVACPATHCGVRVIVDGKTCAGKANKVEVLLGDTLEDHVWKVGEPFVSCRAIPVLGSVVVNARADTPWKWTSGKLSCPEDIAGTTIDHVLECKTN
jgi:hypothetical protein